MKFYSTNNNAPMASLSTAITQGLAPDRGLYMPERIDTLPQAFFSSIDKMSFHQIATTVADAFFGEDIPHDDLEAIVCDTLSFECPIVQVTDNIYSLELFHGPTLAFKDVGARFMARMLRYFNKSDELQPINVLVATSGDTGSAVANGFLGVDGIHVYVLYPKGKVSPIQECQFATLGQNITAIEIEGVFDDCQRIVKTAFLDTELCAAMKLTSANSINVARFLPQSFYYFYAYAQLKRLGLHENVVVSVPSGNFGNITAGLISKRMGLPIKRFIAANNANDIFYNYIQTSIYEPKPSKQTIANAMDVGDPSNFARIIDLYCNSHSAIANDIEAYSYGDECIAKTIKQCLSEYDYLLDPHGACGYRALRENLHSNEIGVFLETAHPAKFKQVVDSIIGADIAIPSKLSAFMQGIKQTVSLSSNYLDFRHFLMQTNQASKTQEIHLV